MLRMFENGFPKPKTALVTGAAGGMGRACARMLAPNYALALTDFNGDGLARATEILRDDENVEIVSSVTGDIRDRNVIDQAFEGAGDDMRVVIHTAGVASVQADWRGIIETNLVATAKLLDALMPRLRPGSVVVLIASSGRFMVKRPSKELLAVMEDPLAEDFVDRMGALLDHDSPGVGDMAYCYTKWWVAREVQRRAAEFARKGARIMSISPGVIWTDMGRRSMFEGQAGFMLEETPAGRWGRPADIAATAEFIVSDKASYLSGSDILVDGGVIARVLSGEALGPAAG